MHFHSLFKAHKMENNIKRLQTKSTKSLKIQTSFKLKMKAKIQELLADQSKDGI